MTKPTLPTSGGSYLRDKDGKLTRADSARPAQSPAPKPAKKES